ncbi:MAG: choice-of-anchor L domain-containing protein, partial [Bacteroidota bacterium]
MKSLLSFAWKSVLAISLFLLPHFAQAQLTVNGVSAFEQYVQNLQGPGVIISNINIECDTLSPAMGGFDATNTTIGLDSGLLLTSGSILGAPVNGPTGTNNFAPGDPLLTAIGTGQSNDACAVEFDVIPSCDTLRIRYVFASHEYPTFVGQFDDIMGIFVTGPGYTPNTNVALIPGTTQAVSINNVNATTNSQYFVDNQTTTIQTEYNGLTTVLEAVIPVQACVTYTIRISVSDEQDFTLDSGVFVEAFSCENLVPGVVIRNTVNANSPVGVEECVDAIATFFNLGDTSVALPINFTLGGTATLGADYNFPATVTVPAGEDSINVLIPILPDNVVEGSESVIIRVVPTNGCASFPDSATLTILDPFEVDAGPDRTICSGETSTLGTTPDPDVAYSWQSGFGLQGNLNSLNPFVNVTTVTPLTFSYIVTATDLINGCVDMDTVVVNIKPLPAADFGIDPDVCVNDLTTIVFTQVQVAGAVYQWDFDGASTINGSGPGPYQVAWNTPGTKTVTMSLLDGTCPSDTIIKTILVNPIPTSSFLATSPVCEGQPAQVNYTGSASMGATYIWDFDGGVGGSGQGPFGVVWNSPGTKDITLTVEEFGCVSPQTTTSVVVNQVPTSDFSLTDSICAEDNTQIVYTGNGLANASYAWSFDGGQIISGSGVGPYVVNWLTAGTKTVCLQVEENGCISTLSCETITILEIPEAEIAPVADQCFGGNSFLFTNIGDPDVDDCTWIFGPDANPPVFTGCTPPAVSYLNPGVKTVSLIVARDGCISDSAQITFEVIPEPSANFSASTGATCQDTCVTFTYTGMSQGPQQTFMWDFGPGAIPATSTQPNPGCIPYATGGTKTVTLTVDYRGCTVSSTQDVNIHPGPVVSAGADVEFCEGDGGAQIDASVSGGTQPYFYSWWCDDPPNCGLSSDVIEDPVANPNVSSPTEEVVYYFQVTDVNGCVSNVDSVVVTVKAKPKMDAGPDVFICEEGPGEFITGGLAANNAAPLPIDYSWTPSTGLNDASVPNPFARPDTTTIYTLIGTSANGCSSEVTTLDTLSTVTVHVNPLPIADAGADTAICLNEAVQLQGFASGAGPTYSYTWTPALPGTIDDPNSPSPNVSPGFTTTFFLVVTSNGCDSDADAVEVIVDTKPTISPGSDETICLREEVQLDGSAAGDPNATIYNYEWTPSLGLSDPSVAKPLASPGTTTTYSVTATSEHGCGSDAAQITVTVEPTAEVRALSVDTLICEGTEIQLSAEHSFTTPVGSPVVYEWRPQNGSVTSSPFLPDVNIRPSTTTLYIVEASVSGDCPTYDSVLVTVSPKVDADLVSDTSRICEGLSVQLSASGGLGAAEYIWSPTMGLSDSIIANPTATPTTSTTYQVIIKEGACSDTASVAIDVNDAPEVDYLFSQNSGCEGLEVSFLENTSNATSFRWDFGDGSAVNNEANPTYIYDLPGEYAVSLTAVGPGGCESTITKTSVAVSASGAALFTSAPTADLELPLPDARIQFTDQSDNAINWLWDFGDGTTSGEANPIHTYTQAGNYMVTLTVTDVNGCVSTFILGPYNVFAPDLMIPNVFSPNEDGINDAWQVQYDGTEVFRVEIFDRWGRSFFAADAVSEAWRGTDPEGNAAVSGVYFYSLMIGEKNYKGNITLV